MQINESHYLLETIEYEKMQEQMMVKNCLKIKIHLKDSEKQIPHLYCIGFTSGQVIFKSGLNQDKVQSKRQVLGQLKTKFLQQPTWDIFQVYMIQCLAK